MRHILFPDTIDTRNRRLPFFLATEEWAARLLPAGEYFFSWQVDPTVICGRNQEVDKEVDLDYCRRNGIDVVRRRSGGGAVFADRQNFMFSLITAGDNVTEVFARYTSLISDALRGLGLDAEATGRNDIMIGGKKVAGNAFYHLPGRCIAHGTMLYDFDPTHLACALTPSKAKMESKGVKSAPNRVTCLKNENIPLSPSEFEQYMIAGLTDGEPYVVTAEDCLAIEAIERGYYEPSFMRISDTAKNPGTQKSSDNSHVCRSTRIDGLGEFCVDYDITPETNTISAFRISGDFFMRADVETEICERLNGITCTPDAVEGLLRNLNVSDVIPGLSHTALADLITREL